jgi:nifR3 family TIM-barrel protein
VRPSFFVLMKIASIEIKNPVVLGPMAGVTTLAYRDFMKPFGVGLSFSEMISDCGIFYGNADTYTYLATSKKDRPVGLQLFGSNPEISAKAISILENKADYDLLDINLGCPVYKVTKTGAGSAWLKHPQELYSYMRTIVTTSHKPVSAKIRLGWDDKSINFAEVSDLLVKAGISFLTIHARTSKQMYMGEANYEPLKDFGRSLSIPLCVSGDIFTPEKAIEAMKFTGASSVMVARGGLGNPRLVSNINHLYFGEEKEADPTVNEEVEWARDFAARLVAQKGEKVALMQLRGLIPHFFSGFPGYKKIRAEIAMNIKTVDDLAKILDGIEKREHL